MKIKLKLIAAALLLAGSAHAQNPTNKNQGEWQSGLENCVVAQSKQAPFNGVIAAGNAGSRYFYQNGFADADGKRAFTRDTPFLLASVGKVYTQAAIGKLLQDGKLKLDASVREYLPELPESFTPISIAHLLNHTSGVAPMMRIEPADAQVMGNARTARDLVALVAAKPLSLPAGKGDEYSNGGYYLLGAVIESVSKQSYRDYIAQQIFKPLNMKSSSFESNAKSAVPLTLFMGPDQPPASKPQPRLEFPALKASSAGGAFSSVADLEIFANALLGNKFLNESTKNAIFSGDKKAWRVNQLGGTVGSNTGFFVLPEEKKWLVVLSNFDPPGAELIAMPLKSVLTGQACKAVPPKGPPLKPITAKNDPTQQAPAQNAAPTLDASTRAQVIDNVIATMNELYVFPDAAKKVEARLRDPAQLQQLNADNGKVFAQSVTDVLRAVTNDKHVHVTYSDAPLPNIRSEPTMQSRGPANFGVEPVQRLPGNIGYLELTGFGPPELAGDAIASAMTALADSDALIIDLRRNNGGHSETVALVSSYLLDKRTHLNDFYFRPTDSTTSSWSLDSVPGKRFGGSKPVYVLTSNRTFSGGEEFAYNLKNLKRATLVGDTTGGGAHPGEMRKINDHFEMFVATGRPINPITKTNWEGVGVEPDVKVKADDALRIAQLRALNAIKNKAADKATRDELSARIAEL